jgi:beta-mannosidase
VIEIRFASVLPMMRAKEEEKHLPTWVYPGAGYVRKMPCNFGWDWAPTVITCGIWRPISLVAFNTSRLDEVEILQDHSKKGEVKLTLKTSAMPVAGLKARITLTPPQGKPMKSVVCALTDGKGAIDLTIDQPKLWWPAGMGAQPLYLVKTELLDAGDRLLDVANKRIGLRTMQVMEQTDTNPMHFVVNGVPFFSKGANWIPSDAFPTRATKEKLRRWMEDAVAVNMNSVRFWGGGYYEDDALFDACDELGICVWMDFKFACSTYPSYDPVFLANVRQEAVEQVKRLRHHPSIGIWCGNNEIMFFRGGDEWKWMTKEQMGGDEAKVGKMSTPDYNLLFKETLGGVMAAHSPQTAYVTGSPDCGDVHFWKVWHDGEPFEAYRDIHGFVSEFGFQSFPVPATAHSFTAPEDRSDVYSPMFKHHEKSDRLKPTSPDDGQIGTEKIMKIVRMNFREPKDFESTLWLSQINQAYGIEFAAEGWRREMPKSMGCVYWQFNDNWPCSSWSSVDYYGRWKALHFRAKHFYAPVLVSGDFNTADNKIALWLTSDAMKPVSGKLTWRVTNLAGKEILMGVKNTIVKERQSLQVGEIELAEVVRKHGAANLLVWLSLDAEGTSLAKNTVLLAKPKDMDLQDPQLTSVVSGSGKNYSVTVRSKRPALWVWLDVTGMDARFSENFVPLAPGAVARFKITLDQPLSKQKLMECLKLRSLFDTYNKSH